jgi:hypothetical protein
MPTTTPTDFLAEFERCRWDPVRFARVMLGIRLHPGQKRMVEAYMKRTDSRWRAFYYWIMVAAGNRAGKTLALSVIILHSCVYRTGLEPPKSADPAELKRYGGLPYHWWHFAVEQAPAEQVFTEIVNLLGGSHPAQKAGCPWADAVGGADKIAKATETAGVEWTKGSKERGEYAWIVFVPELGGAQVHFRSTKAKALSAIGMNMHGLSFDEAGLQEAPTLRYLLEEVMHARRLSTGGQFILISTPSADTSTEYEDLWYTGDPEDPFRDPRRFSMTMSTRDNIGYGIDRESFDALILHQPQAWIDQNIDGKFIQASGVWFNSLSVRAAFHDELPERTEPGGAGHVYAHALDPGLNDKCWSLVAEMDARGDLVGVSLDRQEGKQTTRGIVALGERDHKAYAKGGADIETGVDHTALGGHMFKELLEEAIPVVRTIEFGGVVKTKRQLLSDLRTAFDEGRIRLPSSGYWVEVQKQCLNYKLADRKIEQDLVMCLAIIVKLARALPRPGVVNDNSFDYGVEKNKPSPEAMSASQKVFAGMDMSRTTTGSLTLPE